MDVQNIINKLHPLERRVLPVLDRCNTPREVEEATNLKDVEVMRALQWLSNKKVLTLESVETEVVDIDANGKNYLENGMPEKKLLSIVKESTPLEQAIKKSGLSREEFNVALGVLKRKAAVFITKEKEIVLKIMPQGKKLLKSDTIEEKFLKILPKEVSALSGDEKKVYVDLLKRRNIIKKVIKKDKSFTITELGEEVMGSKLEVDGIIDTLTSSMLKEGSWRKKKFRGYDVTINVPKIYGGKKHIVSQGIEYMKKIWIEMGFTEKTDNLVQSAFWDLDALFVPQDHPARQMQDTFYIKDPSTGKIPQDIMKKVKAAHETGGDTGSKGYQSKWDEKKAKENLLVTHDTFLSAKTLAGLKKEDLPYKSFQIMKVFRNEVVDWKHLFEFYQVGGIVVDENANFRNLLGYLKQFFKKMGYSDVRLRPAHFPYTEPSCEIEVFHPVKKEWIELGGSGIFRPELVKPLLGIDVPVLAWGLGVDRILVDYYKIHDLREIYKNDLGQMKEWKVLNL